MNKNKKFDLMVSVLCVGISAGIIVLMIEFLARQNFEQVLLWLFDYPKPFVLNLLIAFIVIGLMIIITGRIIYGISAGSAVILLLGSINMLKLSVLQTPFFAWDMFYIGQMGALGASFLSKKLIFVFIILLLGLLGSIVYFLIKSIRPLTIRIRIFSFTAAAFLISLFCWETTNPLRLLEIKNIVWDQAQNYSTNGFMLAFSMNISPIFFSQPDEYNIDLVHRLVEHNETFEDECGFRDKPISLIFFMSESFSDLADPLFESSANPLENLKQLASQYPSFRLISPTYAGNTSLVEFEVLTGLSNAFLPSGAIPFDHYLRRQTPSLAWILQEHGYHTIAIHPFYDWFWNRNIVYPNLGFQKYISINQFDESSKRGFYISDEALVDKIIDVIDSIHGPYFIHAVSMENHGPYTPDRFDEPEVQLATSLSNDLRFELASYLSGLQDADEQLAMLLKYLAYRDEPVICLFFGDHQPSFGMDFYSALGKIKQGIEKDYQMSIVPGLLWANRKEIIEAKDIPEQMSPVYLPAIILHQMKFPLPGYMFYLKNGLSSYPVVHRNFVVDPNGNLLRFKECRKDPYLHGLEILNYDILFSLRYSCKL
jgi:phosphoglycerol transferase MdoB-like AlkP superfamily enzyme